MNVEFDYTKTRNRLLRALNRDANYEFVTLEHANPEQFGRFAKADGYDFVRARGWDIEAYREAHGNNPRGLRDSIAARVQNEQEFRFLVKSKQNGIVYQGEVSVWIDTENKRALFYTRMLPSKWSVPSKHVKPKASLHDQVVSGLSRAAKELGINAVEFETLEPLDLTPDEAAKMQYAGARESASPGGGGYQVHAYRYDCERVAGRGAA